MLLNGFTSLLSLEMILLMFGGVIVGIIFGAIPGLSATMAIVLFLPILFYLVVSSQLFQMVSRYNCTVKQYIKNALLVGIAHPLCLIVNIGLGIMPYFAFFYNFSAFLQLTLVWILGIFSFQGYLSGIMSKKFYQRITENLTGEKEEEPAAE